jgi:hypothetical protein
VDEAVDAAIGVMQDEEVPSRTDFTTTGFGDDAQHRHRLERCWSNATADIADHGGFSGREAEYIDGTDAGIDATDNHRLQRRYDLQVCGKAAAGEGLVALGQGVNDTHWGSFLLVLVKGAVALNYYGTIMDEAEVCPGIIKAIAFIILFHG